VRDFSDVIIKSVTDEYLLHVGPITKHLGLQSALVINYNKAGICIIIITSIITSSLNVQLPL